MTRLSRIHPYPGMIADNLAVKLAEKYVRPGDRVLDPFCGTGRTLIAAAERGAHAIGIDTNPLAKLLVLGKSSAVNVAIIKRLADKVEAKNFHENQILEYDIEEGRKVMWFSSKAKRELSSLISFLNQEPLRHQELYLLASILSATAREVSYCRNDQWKIHRMLPAQRSVFRKSAHKVFLSRLKNIISELQSLSLLHGSCKAITGDSMYLQDVLRKHSESERFDLVFSSPPYGDSKTTVQYGGVSALCLGVVKHLNGLNLLGHGNHSIDYSCLGGRVKRVRSADRLVKPISKRYWAGEAESAIGRRVNSFLLDLSRCCEEIVEVLTPRGRTIFVVGRRTVGGSELKLDRYLIGTMQDLGCICEKVTKRKISGKMTPYLIHAKGNSHKSFSKRQSLVPTMREEFVLFFKKTPKR